MSTAVPLPPLCDPQEFEWRQRFLEWDERDAALLARIASLMPEPLVSGNPWSHLVSLGGRLLQVVRQLPAVVPPDEMLHTLLALIKHSWLELSLTLDPWLRSVSSGSPRNEPARPLGDVVAAMAAHSGLSPDELERRLGGLDFTADDRRSLSHAARQLRAVYAPLEDFFFASLFVFNPDIPLFDDAWVVERLNRVEAAWFSQMLGGEYGWGYAQTRLRLGAMHQEMGLVPSWHVLAYSKYLCGLLPALWHGEVGLLEALLKVCLFDLSLALNAYLTYADATGEACGPPGSGLLVVDRDGVIRASLRAPFPIGARVPELLTSGEAGLWRVTVHELPGNAGYGVVLEERDLRELVGNLGVVVWEADATTWQFSFVSRGAQGLLGYPVDEWLSDRGFWWRRIHPDDRELVVSVARNVVCSGQQARFRYRARRADGTWCWIKDSMHPVFDGTVGVRKLRGISVDITAQVAAETRRQVEHRVGRLLTESGDVAQILEALGVGLECREVALWLIDANAGVLRRIEAWPVGAERVLAPGQGLPGQAWLQGAPVRDAGAVALPMQPGVLELLRDLPLDGADLELLSSVAAQVGQFIEHHRTIEERDWFFKLSTDLLGTAGFDGLLREVNPAWREALGGGRGQKLLDLVLAEDRNVVRDALLRLTVAHEPVAFEARMESRRGLRSFAWSAVPAPERETIHLVGHDRTERKQTEMELARARDLAEAANRAKSEFLANMSHEIRTPMNAVMGLTELALEGPLDANQRDYLAVVKNSGEALLDLLNDILDLSHIESGQMELHLGPFMLRDAVEDVVRVLAVRAAVKGIELTCRVAPEIPEPLVGDATRLRQIVMNLVGNAIKFTDRGEIDVEVTRVATAGDHETLHLQVRDTGIGIAEDKLEAVFEAFVQADASTTRRFGGTGLGLAICSRVAQLMGGRIWVESKLGEGSTFHVLVRLSRHMVPVEPAEVSALIGQRVLIADDNPTARRLLEEMVSGWQMRPALADSGDAAWSMLQQAWLEHDPFVIALLDARMPGISGADVVRRVQEHPDLVASPILLVPPGSRVAEPVASLVKPVRRAELLEALLAGVGEARQPRKPVALSVWEESVERPLRILVVEDNAINLKLAVQMLLKRGHRVDAVEDGQAAVARCEAQSYDVVLMDIQMPVLDGFAATRALRERGYHVPVVAMTAYAMRGDREKCLQAGMDGYVSKPLQVRELFAAVEGAATAHPVLENPRVLDLGSLQQREGLHALVERFLKTVPRHLEKLQAAAAARDPVALSQAAEALRGPLQELCAHRCAEAVLQLERLASGGKLAAADAVLELLNAELARLTAALAILS
ncbi:MAG: response regulator [Candidatus Xenobia bacterium]